eukprot:jgi/Bigna1/84001/fgenesh1_pg.120_\
MSLPFLLLLLLLVLLLLLLLLKKKHLHRYAWQRYKDVVRAIHVPETVGTVMSIRFRAAAVKPLFSSSAFSSSSSSSSPLSSPPLAPNAHVAGAPPEMAVASAYCLSPPKPDFPRRKSRTRADGQSLRRLLSSSGGWGTGGGRKPRPLSRHTSISSVLSTPLDKIGRQEDGVTNTDGSNNDTFQQHICEGEEDGGGGDEGGVSEESAAAATTTAAADTASSIIPTLVVALRSPSGGDSRVLFITPSHADTQMREAGAVGDRMQQLRVYEAQELIDGELPPVPPASGDDGGGGNHHPESTSRLSSRSSTPIIIPTTMARGGGTRYDRRKSRSPSPLLPAARKPSTNYSGRASTLPRKLGMSHASPSAERKRKVTAKTSSSLPRRMKKNDSTHGAHNAASESAEAAFSPPTLSSRPPRRAPSHVHSPGRVAEVAAGDTCIDCNASMAANSDTRSFASGYGGGAASCYSSSSYLPESIMPTVNKDNFTLIAPLKFKAAWEALHRKLKSFIGSIREVSIEEKLTLKQQQECAYAEKAIRSKGKELLTLLPTIRLVDDYEQALQRARELEAAAAAALLLEKSARERKQKQASRSDGKTPSSSASPPATINDEKHHHDDDDDGGGGGGKETQGDSENYQALVKVLREKCTALQKQLDSERDRKRNDHAKTKSLEYRLQYLESEAKRHAEKAMADAEQLRIEAESAASRIEKLEKESRALEAERSKLSQRLQEACGGLKLEQEKARRFKSALDSQVNEANALVNKIASIMAECTGGDGVAGCGGRGERTGGKRSASAHAGAGDVMGGALEHAAPVVGDPPPPLSTASLSQLLTDLKRMEALSLSRKQKNSSALDAAHNADVKARNSRRHDQQEQQQQQQQQLQSSALLRLESTTGAAADSAGAVKDEEMTKQRQSCLKIRENFKEEADARGTQRHTKEEIITAEAASEAGSASEAEANSVAKLLQERLDMLEKANADALKKVGEEHADEISKMRKNHAIEMKEQARAHDIESQRINKALDAIVVKHKQEMEAKESRCRELLDRVEERERQALADLAQAARAAEEKEGKLEAEISRLKSLVVASRREGEEEEEGDDDINSRVGSLAGRRRRSRQEATALSSPFLYSPSSPTGSGERGGGRGRSRRRHSSLIMAISQNRRQLMLAERDLQASKDANAKLLLLQEKLELQFSEELSAAKAAQKKTELGALRRIDEQENHYSKLMREAEAEHRQHIGRLTEKGIELAQRMEKMRSLAAERREELKDAERRHSAELAAVRNAAELNLANAKGRLEKEFKQRVLLLKAKGGSIDSPTESPAPSDLNGKPTGFSVNPMRRNKTPADGSADDDLLNRSDSSLLEYLTEEKQEPDKNEVKEAAHGADSDAAAAAAAAASVTKTAEEKKEDRVVLHSKSSQAKIKSHGGGDDDDDDDERKWSFSWDPETDTQRMFLEHPTSQQRQPPASMIITSTLGQDTNEDVSSFRARRSTEVAHISSSPDGSLSRGEVQLVGALPVFVKEREALLLQYVQREFVAMLDSLPEPSGIAYHEDARGMLMRSSSNACMEKLAMRTCAATPEIAVLEDQLDGVQREHDRVNEELKRLKVEHAVLGKRFRTLGTAHDLALRDLRELHQRGQLTSLERRNLHSNLDAAFARVEEARRRRGGAQVNHSSRHFGNDSGEDDAGSDSPTRSSSAKSSLRGAIERSRTRGCGVTSRSQPLTRLGEGVEEADNSSSKSYRQNHRIHISRSGSIHVLPVASNQSPTMKYQQLEARSLQDHDDRSSSSRSSDS